MNLLAGLLILLCLIGSELIGARVAEDWIHRSLAVFLTAALVPATAFFQTTALLYKMQRENFSYAAKRSLCQRMTISHSLVWLSASCAIIWALRWQDIVRGNWQLDQWPLVDDLLILAPAIVSMVASWAVFYELQVAVLGPLRIGSGFDDPVVEAATSRVREFFRRLGNGLNQWLRQSSPRWEFVSIRFRVYFLMMLVPVCAVVLCRDLASTVTNWPEPVAAAVTIIGLAVIVLAFPFAMLVVWKNGPIVDSELRHQLWDVCNANRLRVLDIRTWHTGHQVVNAAVAGFFPWLRVIFLSDRLLQQFTPAEIQAVMRHEAAHIRRGHIPIRLFFIATPLMLLASQNWLVADGRQHNFQVLLGELNWTLSVDPLTVSVLIVELIGLLLTNRWLSHQIEFDADLSAIQSDYLPGDHPSSRPICCDRAKAMSDALLRLAELSPVDWNRATLLHPSLQRRVEFIRLVESDASVGDRFRHSLRIKQIGLAIGWSILTGITLLS